VAAIHRIVATTALFHLYSPDDFPASHRSTANIDISFKAMLLEFSDKKSLSEGRATDISKTNKHDPNLCRVRRSRQSRTGIDGVQS